MTPPTRPNAERVLELLDERAMILRQLAGAQTLEASYRQAHADVYRKWQKERDTVRSARDRVEFLEDLTQAKDRRIEQLERGLITVADGPSSSGVLALLLLCPVCGGAGGSDNGACGDPECCGPAWDECDYCKGEGTLRGRWPQEQQ